MIKTINTQKQHWKKVAKFCRLLEKFNDNITDSIKLAIKNGFNVQLNEQGKVVGYKCHNCGKDYVRIGWVQKHNC